MTVTAADAVRKLVELKPDPNNPREISMEARARLKAIIERFGVIEPLVIDEDGVLIGGHRRREILLELGADEVPVRIVSGLSPDERLTLMVALNNAEAQGTYNLPKLAEVLASIDPAELPFTGFSLNFLASLEPPPAPVRLEPVETKAPPRLAWALIGVPLAAWSKIAPAVETAAEIQGAIVETSVSDR